jgi:hypothetical protein
MAFNGENVRNVWAGIKRMKHNDWRGDGLRQRNSKQFDIFNGGYIRHLDRGIWWRNILALAISMILWRRKGIGVRVKRLGENGNLIGDGGCSDVTNISIVGREADI